ncbi:MAG: response regulator [Methanothrix sp.]|nr:response regulator [Methanothrix sp.]
MIIDDDRVMLNSFKLLLEMKGYLTDTAESGSEAIEKVRCKYFNLALIDISLPDMDGTALLSEFRELNPEMKKIIITGYSTRENAIESLNLGANAYLEKPVTPGKLLEFVTKKLAEQEYEIKYHEDTVNNLIQSRKQA